MLKIYRDTKSDIMKLMEENPAWTIKRKEAIFGLRSSCSENHWRPGKYHYIPTVFLYSFLYSDAGQCQDKSLIQTNLWFDPVKLFFYATGLSSQHFV